MLNTRGGRRLVFGLLVLYAALGLAWAAFAYWVAPAVIAAAHEGRSLALFNRVLQSRSHPVAHYLRLWSEFSQAVLLGGVLHLVVVILVLRLDRQGDARRSVAERGRWARVKLVLILFALLFLGLTVASGPRHDYVADLEIWGEVSAGHDPWWVVPERGAPLNAYGPLFNVLAAVVWVNPLGAKLLFALTYILFVLWLLASAARRGGPGESSALALAALLANPYVWVEIPYFGHFDILVGAACVAAVVAQMRGRDVRAGTWLALGVLLKYIPLALLPFLAFEGRRLRPRLLLTALGGILVGMTVSVLVWGPSTFRPITVATGRGSTLLSIFRFLRGQWSPLRLFSSAPDCDKLALPCLVAAGGSLFVWCRARRVDPAASAVLALLTTLLFYQVGFLQYQIVLLCLVLYWWHVVRDHGPSDPLVCGALVAYFGWLAGYNIFSAATGGVVHPDDPWAWVEEVVGLPTFVLGIFLVFVLMRASVKRAEPLSALLPEQA